LKGMGKLDFIYLHLSVDSLVIETWKKFPRWTLGKAPQNRIFFVETVYALFSCKLLWPGLLSVWGIGLLDLKLLGKEGPPFTWLLLFPSLQTVYWLAGEKVASIDWVLCGVWGQEGSF
jgi:FtsH-binding integral membrane protein